MSKEMLERKIEMRLPSLESSVRETERSMFDPEVQLKLREMGMNLELEKERNVLEREKLELAKQREKRIIAELELQKQKVEYIEERGDCAKARVPKLPIFNEERDEIDCYINRFERYAKVQKWSQCDWATNLSALLTGGALEVYSRLATKDADDYQVLKHALLKRYDFTPDGFRKQFVHISPKPNETAYQYGTRLEHVFTRWIEMENTTQSFDGLKDLILRTQFVEGCPLDLALFLKEKQFVSYKETMLCTERYLEARGGHFDSLETEKPQCLVNHSVQPRSYNVNQIIPHVGNTQQRSAYTPNSSQITCFKCNRPGHRARDCKVVRKCRNCGKIGHFSSNCKFPTQSAGCQVDTDVEEIVGCLMVKVPEIQCNFGQSFERVSFACNSSNAVRMPVVKGKIGDTLVSVLRDSGCSGVVVRRNLVSESDFYRRTSTVYSY
ncbi:uncharacterized protein LOC117114683 [Anneissia japonica]|uniref:uncharacterized protein LOC117114683 n=1 Tax=Anneissia japonica TaxID=1529436 RepID=UPI0014259E9C|nr:uncharacterized protein LOC117114683 [Anneissia japonica]